MASTYAALPISPAALYGLAGTYNRWIIAEPVRGDLTDDLLRPGVWSSDGKIASPVSQEAAESVRQYLDRIPGAEDMTLVLFSSGQAPSEKSVLAALQKGRSALANNEEEQRAERREKEDKRRENRRGYFGLSEPLPFGKHRGKPVKWIIDTHPGYIRWMLEEMGKNVLNDEALSYYEDKLGRKV